MNKLATWAIAAIALLTTTTLPVSSTALAQNPPPQFRDGTYRVNEQVAPGTYRSTGKGSRCYWQRTGEGDDILHNHYGLTGGVVTIQVTDFEFESKGCGPWVALDLNNRVGLPADQQVAPKKDGFYVVGVDIAPGIWKSTGQGSRCYWARQNTTQDILDNHVGFTGGAVTIHPNDIEFYTKDCGTWTMLDANNLPAAPIEQQRAAKKDGIYIIGLNMAPGRWRSSGLGKSCYWQTLTASQDIIDNHFGVASVIVEIAPTDFQFEAKGCGLWTLSDGVGTPIDQSGVSAGIAPAPAPAGKAACPTADVCILTPANGTRVPRGSIVAFTGTATNPAFVRYQFLAGNGETWGHIADFKKAVVNGDLMELHTDSLPSGTYTIRMQVIDNTGNAVPDKAEIQLTIE